MHKYSAAMTAYQAIVAATPTTLIQLVTPSTRRARLLQLSVGFKSTTTTDAAALVQLVTQTTAGTSSATLTPSPLDRADPASLLTANITFSAEGTTGVSLYSWNLVVQSGLLVMPLADLDMILAVSTRVGLTVNTPQAQNAIATLTWQE